MSEWEGVTLDQAKAWLRKHVDEGVACPCCGQMAKVYRRKIHSSMARALITLSRNGPGFQRLTEVLEHHQIADTSKLRYWDLIEEETVRRPDGGRSGWWRVTATGQSWVNSHHTVPKYARIYDGRCLDLIGPQVSIRDALGDKFDYDELMR